MRALVLREEPLCRRCLEAEPSRITPATVADHIMPKAQGGTDGYDVERRIVAGYEAAQAAGMRVEA